MSKIGYSTTLKQIDEQLIVEHKLSQKKKFQYFLIVAGIFIALAALLTAITSTLDDISGSAFEITTWENVNLKNALLLTLVGLIIALIVFYVYIFILVSFSKRLIGFTQIDQIQSILMMISFLALISNGLFDFHPLIHTILLFFVSITYFTYSYAFQRAVVLTKIISTSKDAEIITRLDYPLAGILPPSTHNWYPNQNKEIQFTIQIRETPKSLTEPTPSGKIFRNINQDEYQLIHENKEISNRYNIMIVSGDVTSGYPTDLKLWGLSIAEFSNVSDVIRFERSINEFISFRFCEIIRVEN